MKFKTRTALGIDISTNRINLAVVKRSKKGVELLKAATGAVPEGAIKDGNIQDHSLIAKAIKELKARNKIYTRRTAVSPLITPMLMQILNLPNNFSGSIASFVQDEVRHYAVLSMKNVAIDFCGIKSPNKLGERRVFVVATDGQKIAECADALSGSGLNIDVIEPAATAYIRACYAKKIAERFDENLLFAILHEGILTLCLFKNQSLDFVEIKPLESEILSSDQCFEWVVDKINAVIKFYELKVHDKCDKWQIHFVTDASNETANEKALAAAAKIKHGETFADLYQSSHKIEFNATKLEQAYLDTPIGDTKHAVKPSAVAVGLAMKLLDFPGCGLNVNLLPPETAEVKSARKQALIIANVAAAVFVFMVLCTGFFDLRVKSVNGTIKRIQRTKQGRSIQNLLAEQASLNERINDVTENFDSMNNLLRGTAFVNWCQILNEISSATPRTVRITNLFSEDSSKVIFKGQAVTYESVHLFVEMLNGCEQVRTASLVGTEKDEERGGLITYSIRCSLNEPQGQL